MKKQWQKIAGLVAGMLVLAAVVGPLPTANAALTSIQSEIEQGQKYAKQVEQKYGLVNDAALQDRIASIGARIAAVSDRQDLPYTFKVLNIDQINAITLPGGYIYVFKGLTDKLTSDEEVAAILAHEVGHAAKRHPIEVWEKSTAAVLIYTVLVGSNGNLLSNLLMEALLQGYSRDKEREADQLGFQYTLRAGLNPYSSLVAMQHMLELEPQNASAGGLFSSHPDMTSRVKQIEGQMNDRRIHPLVQAGNDSAQITDTGLALPPLYATYHGFKPFYRACFAAGKLYQVLQRPDFNGDYFVVMDNDPYIVILYDDFEILTLTPKDAMANKVSLPDLADQYVQNLEAWAQTAKR